MGDGVEVLFLELQFAKNPLERGEGTVPSQCLCAGSVGKKVAQLERESLKSLSPH